MAKELDPESPAAKGYETPTFDRLRPRYKTFVLSVLKHGDEHQAALDAGYGKTTAAIYGFEIGRLPEVVKAMEELSSRSLTNSEFARAATISRLRVESVVTLHDLAKETEYEWRDTKRTKWIPKSVEEVEPQFRQCTGFCTVSREGHAQFNTSAQQKSRELLAKYMKWDKEERDSAPSISYNFSGIKD